MHALVRNNMALSVKRVDVEVVTVPAAGRLTATTLYYLPGNFPHGAWKQASSHKSALEVQNVPWDRGAQLSPVKECFAQAAVFDDGSIKVLYSPL